MRHNITSVDSSSETAESTPISSNCKLTGNNPRDIADAVWLVSENSLVDGEHMKPAIYNIDLDGDVICH